MRVSGFKPSYGDGVDDQFKLLRNLAEDLKVPLTHIISNTNNKALIEKTAISTVSLVDSYILCNKLASGQLSLHIEPVALNPLFDEVADNLSNFAKNNGVEFATNYRKSHLVLSDKRVLKSMFNALSYSLIYSNPKRDRSVIKFKTKKFDKRVNAGVFYDSFIKANDLKKLRTLSGRASVPSSNFSFGTSSGIAIADVFSRILSSELSVTKNNHKSGFEISLLPSEQLSLV